MNNNDLVIIWSLNTFVYQFVRNENRINIKCSFKIQWMDGYSHGPRGFQIQWNSLNSLDVWLSKNDYMYFSAGYHVAKFKFALEDLLSERLQTRCDWKTLSLFPMLCIYLNSFVQHKSFSSFISYGNLFENEQHQQQN